MPFDYSASAQTALGLLENFGKAWDIVRIAQDFDPVESEASEAVKVTGSAVLVVLPFSKDNIARMDDNQKEALTLNRLRKCIVAASGLAFAPKPGDWLPNLQGECYKIGEVTPLMVADVPLIYYVIAEKTPMSDADKNAEEAT